MTVTIRDAGPEDYESVHCFLMQEFIEAGYGAADMAALEGQPCHPSAAAAAVTVQGAAPRAWLAAADGRDVGLITHKDSGGGVIVAAGYRGRGIGSMLIAARADYCARQGATEAIAHVAADNEASLRAFSKAGYQFTQAAQAQIDAAQAIGIARADMKEAETGRPAILMLVKTLCP